MANGMVCDNCVDSNGDANFSFPHGTILCFEDMSESALSNTNMSDRSDSNIIIMAEGVKNSVGFDWHPDSDSFYFTDNGRDEIHWQYPDDELNYVLNGTEDTHFGFPWCHTLGSGDTDDRDVGCGISYEYPNTSRSCSSYEKALQPLGSHVVPLGMRFYNPVGDAYAFPDDYNNAIFIAQRGSGNTSFPGYRISVVKLDDDDETNVTNLEVFAEGWLDGSDIYGRPVDVEVLYDGSLVISDDYSDLIYRVSYEGSSGQDVFEADDAATCNYTYAGEETTTTTTAAPTTAAPTAPTDGPTDQPTAQPTTDAPTTSNR